MTARDPALDAFQTVIDRVRLRAASDANEQTFLDETVRSVAVALRVPLCKMIELEATGATLLVRAGVGWQPGVVGVERIAVGVESQAGLTLRTGMPTIFENLARTKRFTKADLLRRHAVISSIATVIGTSERPVGVLSAHTTERRRFTAAETKFLRAVAALIGDGLERRRAAGSQPLTSNAPV
jgi:GAF domain-containing protein